VVYDGGDKLLRDVGNRSLLLRLLVLLFILNVVVTYFWYEKTGVIYGSGGWIDENNTCHFCDVPFHLQRSDTWVFNESILSNDITYAPAFHVFTGLIARGFNIDTEIALVIFSNFILIILIPLALYYLSGFYNNPRRQILTVLIWIFATHHIRTTLGWGTYAHSLGLFFSFVTIYYMVRNMQTGMSRYHINATLTALLTILSHQGTGAYILGVYGLYLIFTKRYAVIALLLIVVACVYLAYPSYASRPLTYMDAAQHEARSGGYVIKTMLGGEYFIWVNPFVVLCMFYGIPRRFKRIDYFIWISFLTPILFFWADPNGRTLMQVNALVCIIAAKAIVMPRKWKGLFLVVVGWVLLVTMQGILGIRLN